MPAKKGDKVSVEYTGTLDDGTVFDSSELHGQSLEFEVGSGQMIKGFDDAVVGMEIGEEKDIHIGCDDAYGQPDEKLVQSLPKDQFPQTKGMKEGSILGIKLPNGAMLPVRVVKIEGDLVTLDMNHPLCGKDLNFKIKLMEIVPA